MSELFRREAVSQATQRLTGNVVLTTPLSLRILGGLLVGILVLAVTFASTATYARKETVTGWIVPEAGLIRVTTQQAGIVEGLNVGEGADVLAGQSLVSVRLSTDTPTGNSGAAMVRDLVAEADADEAAARASQAQLAAQATEWRGRRRDIQKELAETRSRQDILRRRLELADEQVARGEILQAKGFLTNSSMDALKSTALAAAQDVSEVRAVILGIERQIGDLDRQLTSMPADLAAINARTAQARATLSQRGVTLEAQTTLVATAPMEGRVVAVLVERGQAIGAGAALAIITPRNSDLIAELFIPSRAAGFIQVGQDVHLMYQAFPYQRFGTGTGIVQSISRTVLAPNEVPIPGGAVREAVFRVRVKLHRTSVRAYGRDVRLQPGMQLSADVVIDRRTLLQWLLDPLYAAGRRS